ncbi:MAG TPA: hypothetical protein VJ377_02965 [Dehalococcoidales bacterium]|nr:hypothetical protein [Dehalococcoidales bacterium]
MMVRKLFYLTFVVIVILALFTGCTSTNTADTTDNSQVPYTANRTNYRVLNDEEIAELIAIASQHPTVAGWIEDGLEFKTGLVWVSVGKGGGYALIPWDPENSTWGGSWRDPATIYPAVTFGHGQTVVMVAVDMNTKKMVYVSEGPFPKGPIPNPELTK